MNVLIFYCVFILLCGNEGIGIPFGGTQSANGSGFATPMRTVPRGAPFNA